jgi:hypothetical protein
LYIEINSAEGEDGAGAHSEQFNRALEQLKGEYPDNEFVQGMDKARTPSRRNPVADKGINQSVKSKCGQLADALGYDLPTTELESVDELTVISMANEQVSEQTANQQLSFEQVNQMVQLTPLGSNESEELKDIVQEFEDELDGDKDPGTLRELLKKAEEYSTDVAAKLAMLCLKKGVTGILNLG